MYLFLSIPPYSGSTLIHNLLETSKNVAPLAYTQQNALPSQGANAKGYVEGWSLKDLGPEIREEPCFQLSHFEPKREYMLAAHSYGNWSKLMACWERNWKKSNPTAKIKLQKHPDDIYRVQFLSKLFTPTKWIVSVRNPYNATEALIRRWVEETKRAPSVTELYQLCFQVVRGLQIQKQNVEFLKDNAYVVTYENFCENPQYHKKQILNFLPELEDLDFESPLYTKGHFSVIKNDNEDKLNELKKYFPDIIGQLNEIFDTFDYFDELLAYWGYERM
jgi:hypothetical protein